MPKPPLQIYLLTHDVSDYDTLTSAIVCARSEEDARNMHPYKEMFKDQEPELDFWRAYGPKGTKDWGSSPKKVKARLLGLADPSLKQGLVYGHDFCG